MDDSLRLHLVLGHPSVWVVISRLTRYVGHLRQFNIPLCASYPQSEGI